MKFMNTKISIVKTHLVHGFIYVAFLFNSCEENEFSFEKYDNSKTYSVTTSTYDSGLHGLHQGVHTATLEILPESTPEEESANLVETNCDYNHFLLEHNLVSAFSGIVGNFESFMFPNKLSFEFPLDLAYDWITPNSAKHYYYSDFSLFRIPLDDSKPTTLDCILEEDSWETLPLIWTDTLISDYANPIVTCYSYVTDLNSLYVVGRNSNH